MERGPRCGYKPCENKSTRIVEQDEKWVKVYCEEHDAYTSWLRSDFEERKPLKVIKPEFSVDKLIDKHTKDRR